MGYYITKERLLELLETEARYEALQSGGVDNWEWYGEANREYLRTIDVPQPLYEEEITFERVAEEQLWYEFQDKEMKVLGRKD